MNTRRPRRSLGRSRSCLAYSSIPIPSDLLRQNVVVVDPIAFPEFYSRSHGSDRSSQLVASVSAILTSYSVSESENVIPFHELNPDGSFQVYLDPSGSSSAAVLDSSDVRANSLTIGTGRLNLPPSSHSANSRSSNGNGSSSADHFHREATNQIQGMSVSIDTSNTSSNTTFQSHEDELQSIILTASYCYYAHDYTRMITLLSNADSYPETLVKLKCAIQFGKGIAHFKLRRYELATFWFLQLVEEASKSHLDGEICLANYYLAEVEYTRSKFMLASQYYSIAVDHYGASDVGSMYKIELPSRSVVCCKYANSLRYGSKIMEAINLYRKAIDHAKYEHNSKDRLSAHTSLGNLYQGIGDYNNAIAEYEVTCDLAKELGDKVSLGWVYGNLGSAYLGQNKPEKARSYLESSLTLTLEFDPTPQSIGRAYNNLGTVYQSMGDPIKAREYYDMALSQALYADDQSGQARVNGNLGNLHMLQDKFKDAIYYYTEALAIGRDRSTQTTAYHNRGCARYELGEIKRAQYLSSEQGQVAKGKSSLILVGPDMADCEIEHQFLDLFSKTPLEYGEAKSDLEKVQKHHEQTFEDIKGSAQGLNLSVSLFESHAKTFQRLQDCCYLLGQWQQGLVYAEQSRCRALGELMLQKKSRNLRSSFHTPLNLLQIQSIVQHQSLPVVYMTYTSSRLLVWVMVPIEKHDISFNMFQVALGPKQFDNNSFDHMMRVSLSETLTEARVQMYGTCSYTDKTLLNDLHELVVKPLKTVFKKVPTLERKSDLDEVILILDTYTKLIPMAALQDPVTHQFLGDSLRFHCMHSLLTMGILNQLPSAVVHIPQDSPGMCIVGNPHIPRFQYNGEQWNLGRLPFATEEAEWVAHILHARPTLHEQATKDVVMTMLNTAKVVHLATHGSSAAGFLVFAGVNSMSFEPRSILLYPNEIEGLAIPASLVVLSSCDSGRGAMKADGIQGIARSFLLAGAQSVLTSLWRVPDESASFFMQFFYRFLVDGCPSLRALQKAMLSIRCFAKYGDYIHWSGYQLSGRQIQFEAVDDHSLKDACGSSTPFPRLTELLKLETSLIFQPARKADLQFITGCIGMNSLEFVVDYLIKHEAHYTGGMFWIDGSSNESITAGLQSIAEYLLVYSIESSVAKTSEALVRYFSSVSPAPILLVLDNMQELSSLVDNLPLSVLIHRPTTHTIVLSSGHIAGEKVTNMAHNKLIRGCNVTTLKPLTWIQSAQRVVYYLMSLYDVCPMNEDQELFQELAELVRGCPCIIDLVCHSINALTMRHRGGVMQGLREFEIQVLEPTWNEADLLSPMDDWCLGVFISKLLSSLNLSALTLFSLSCLSLLNSAPCHILLLHSLEKYLIELLPDIRFDWEQDLHRNSLVCPYPRPTILLPLEERVRKRDDILVDRWFYVPDVISSTVYSLMESKDKVMSCGVLQRVLGSLLLRKDCKESHKLHFHQLQHRLLTTVQEDVENYSEDIFNAVFQQYISTKISKEKTQIFD